jgi:hypothetical protein
MASRPAAEIEAAKRERDDASRTYDLVSRGLE